MSVKELTRKRGQTLVGADDHDAVRDVVRACRRLKPRNDRVLAPRVLELGNLDLQVLVRLGDLLDLAEEELLRLLAGV